MFRRGTWPLVINSSRTEIAYTFYPRDLNLVHLRPTRSATSEIQPTGVLTFCPRESKLNLLSLYSGFPDGAILALIRLIN